MSTHRLAPGTVLGRYELLLPIAQGGMATVWAARQKGSRGFSKTVAVKTMLPNLSEDETFEQMFLDEASIASKIHHPNVAEILDLGEQDEILYLVMEWVDGESLSALSKQTKKTETEIPIRVALKIVAQACAGLHAAHELKDDSDRLVELVHRDVSPQNILCSSSGLVKLVDFGVAKALGRSGATNVGQLKGKVPYMSPEQTRGHDVDRRTDIFAMGSVLYRITTGSHPFIEDNDIRTMRSIATRPPIKPTLRNARIPEALEPIILKALEKSPKKRYQTAAELGADIEKVLTDTGGQVAIEEVGAFVRSTLGERDQKRRAALRDAALAADETRRPGSASAPPSRISSATISDIMLTKTSTPASFPSGVVQLPDDDSAPGGAASALAGASRVANGDLDGSDEPTRVVGSLADLDAAEVTIVRPSPLDAAASKAASFRPSEPPVASVPTLAAMSSGASPGARDVKRRNGAIAIAAMALLGSIALTLAVARHPAAPPHPPSVSTEESAPRAEATASPDDAPPASAAPVLAAAPDGSAYSVNQLPDNVETPRKRPRSHAASGQHDPAPAQLKPGTPAAKAATDADKTPALPAAPPAPATAKPWVPAVQEPGF